jgi:hypothetical protein
MKLMRYFKTGEGQYGKGDMFMGVRMAQIFEMAKAYINMPLEEIENCCCKARSTKSVQERLSIIDKQAQKQKDDARPSETIL